MGYNKVEAMICCFLISALIIEIFINNRRK